MNIYRGRTHTEVYLASILYDSIEDQDISSVIKLLEEKNADPNIVLPRRGISCFHLAVGNESEKFALQVTMLIIQHGGHPNVRSDEGLTPVHIAAAWGRLDILEVLLKCGGDPQITDNCYKSPIHYARGEKHQEAVQIMQEFVSSQRTALFSNCDKAAYIMALDKVLVSNGNVIGEYKISETQPSRNDINQKNLSGLPERNNSDYIVTWCNSQDPSNACQECNEVVLESASDFIPSSQSSQESQKYDYLFVTQRKRNISINCNYNGKATYRRESSRESGVLTLPESDTEESTKSIHKHKIDMIHDDVFLNDKKMTYLEKNKESSSDYCTCTDGSLDLNPLERNIYEISKTNSFQKTASSIDATFVSISEVYKYTDEQEGVVLYEKRVLTPSVAGSGNESVITTLSQVSLPTTFDYDTDTLRKELVSQGFDPGPITKTTKRVYLKKLFHIKKHPEAAVAPAGKCGKVYSKELQKTLEEPSFHLDLTNYGPLEDAMKAQFINPDPNRRWREGVAKSSFTYLLLDPRITQNLPNRYEHLDKSEIWQTFLNAIFYVGKGKRSRPYAHLYDAVESYSKDMEVTCKKLRKIMDIWDDKCGVICLHLFQNTIPVEAYTREAAMINALRIENVTNKKHGDYYGVAATWTLQQKCSFGVFLLYKALQIFLHEGERQLFPNDID